MLPQDWLPDESIVEGMRAVGAPADVIERVRSGINARRAQLETVYGTGDCEIWADNLPVFKAFMDLKHQWIYSGINGVRTGLCFASIRTWLEINITGRHRDKRRREMFESLLVIESAVIAADRELASEENKR